MLNYSQLELDLEKDGFDVNRVTDRLGTPIDEKIKPLVTVLRTFGYETTQSCEGHPLPEKRCRILNNPHYNKIEVIEDTEHRFVAEAREPEDPETYRRWEVDESPWVDLDLSRREKEGLVEDVKDYNRDGEVEWKLEDEYWDGLRGKITRLKTRPAYPLPKMQADIPSLAEFLYERHEQVSLSERLSRGMLQLLG